MGRMRQFAAALVAAALAVVAAVAGILALTVWRPADQVVASATPDEPYVMTRDGVLPLQGEGRQVTVTVEAADPSSTVDLVVGTPTDVLGWIGDAGYTEVVGIAQGWTALKVVDHPGVAASRTPSGDASQSGQSGASAVQSGDTAQSGSAAQSGATAQSGAQSPLGNDMWLQETSGTGTASLTLSDVPADRSVLAAVEGGAAAPAITVTWAVEQGNGGAVAAFSLAGLFLAVAAILFLLEWRTVRQRRRRAADGADTPGGAGALDAPWPPPGDEPGGTAPLAAKGAPATAQEEPDDQEEATAEEADAPVVERASLLGRHAGMTSADDQDPPETVPTDSGLIDLSAIREGMALPSRRALREARDRGEDRFVVDGHEFDTGISRAIRPEGPQSAETAGGGEGRWSSVIAGWRRRTSKGDSDEA